MARMSRTDFSGGIMEAFAASDFTERQSAIMKGFVLESERQLRSQWACHEVPSNLSDIADMWTLRDDLGETVLLALTASGGLYWLKAPAAGVKPAAQSWNLLYEGLQGAWFVCDVPWRDDSELNRQGVLIQPRFSSQDASISPALIVYLGNGNVPQSQQVVGRYPRTVTEGESVYGQTGVLPWSRQGVMWGDYLVLGDVYASSTDKPTDFAFNKKRRYTNGIWISATPATLGQDSFRIDQFDPRVGFFTIGSPESRIIGLVPIDAGLLVYTTSATAGDGLILLRGNPPGLLTDFKTFSFRAEPLRAGLGAARNAVEPVCVPWPEGGTVAVLDSRGVAWTTNGGQVVQLDQYGPAPVGTALATDALVPFGKYMLMYRQGRMYAFRLFGQDGAWTELIVPQHIRTLIPDLNCIWFTVRTSNGAAGGKLWRFTLNADVERGQLNGQPQQLVLGSATFGGPEFDKEIWHRTGVAYKGPGDVTSITTVAGPALDDDAVRYTVPVTRELGDRAEVVVRAGIGPSHEASMIAKFTGDVSVEELYIEAVGRKPRR